MNSCSPTYNPPDLPSGKATVIVLSRLEQPHQNKSETFVTVRGDCREITQPACPFELSRASREEHRWHRLGENFKILSERPVVDVPAIERIELFKPSI